VLVELRLQLSGWPERAGHQSRGAGVGAGRRVGLGGARGYARGVGGSAAAHVGVAAVMRRAGCGSRGLGSWREARRLQVRRSGCQARVSRREKREKRGSG
jgi:hypothetical protein